MEDEAKLCSSVRSTFEAMVVQPKVGHCLREELGSFCGLMSTAGIAFLLHIINLLSTLLRCNCFTRTEKAVVDQMGSRPPNIELGLLLVQV